MSASSGDRGVTMRLLRRDDSPVHGTIFRPAGECRGRAAVLVIGGSGGGEAWPQAIAFAEAGIPALSVAYFKAPGLGSELRDIELSYFDTAIGCLMDELSLGDRAVVIVGTSRGSEAALLTAAHFPKSVCGVVASVPGNVTLCSWPPGGPAWLLLGVPLPYVSQFGPDSDVPEALIPVERIPGPVLLVSAGRDQVWPSTPMARAISERLNRLGHTFGHLLLDYPEAGHGVGFLTPAVRTSKCSTSDADERARADAWPKVLAFIDDAPARAVHA